MADAKRSAADSRRDFLQKSSVLAGAAVVGSLAVPRSVHAAQSETLRIGLVGCGGRGSGAAVNAMKADDNCKLVALADAFPDQVEECRKRLQQAGGTKFDVTPDRCFSGFDAYQKLIDCGVDVVLLATPPHFRPEHFRACVEAGKHVFVEKPVAVDAPGVRSVMETNKLAREKNLAVVSGLCWRYDHGVRETIGRIHDGAIGDVVAIQSNYNAGTLWHRGDNPDWSRMEYQMRNWLYYTWLSGDHNVEQHIHSLDKTTWLLGDIAPERATGLGGRQQRTADKWGHIFDHHAVVYEYPGGVRVFAYCRQQDGCSNDVDEYVMGTKGQAIVLKNVIDGESRWRYRGSKPNMYDVEHEELFASIRSGQPINNGDYMARSTMIAIMGRMCTYTGQTLSWDECLNSAERLGPVEYAWTDVPEPEVAIPGRTQFA
ncbi:MAG: Gfo/Idh/MocA family oxidoreductase [Pirellulales bacterium]